MILHLVNLICLPMAIAMIRPTGAGSMPLMIIAATTELWIAINIVMLFRAWRALRARGWADDLTERCVLFGMPVDFWIIRHRDELVMTPLYSHSTLEYDNYRTLLRHRGRRFPLVWHFAPFGFLFVGVFWIAAAIAL